MLRCRKVKIMKVIKIENKKLSRYWKTNIVKTGGGQNLKRRNVEWPIFRNSKIANSKITKCELGDIFILSLFFHVFGIIWIVKVIDDFLNLRCGFSKLENFENLTISKIRSFSKLINYRNFFNILNCKFLEFEIGNLFDLPNWKIY